MQKKLGIEEKELDRLTNESLKRFHKQMRRISSKKLRFIFKKKEDELIHAVNSHSLDKFDSNNISYLKNMAKHKKNAPKAHEL